MGQAGRCGAASEPRSGGVWKTLWGWSQGDSSPSPQNLRTKISSTKKNRPLDNRIQVIYIMVNKCSNEQKVTNIPSFSSL